MSDEPVPFETPANSPVPSEKPYKRRPRYSGKYPRKFEEKYKERNPEKYGDTIAKVLASGKTPAGSHRSIMVREILEVLAPKPGEIAADCTLGFGGHTKEILKAIQPGGRLLGLDVDPIELPKTEARLRELGFGAEIFRAYRSNFAGLPQVLTQESLPGVDVILADLGLSSMQIDDPVRGFSVKFEGPLDMRMNPQRGQPASSFLQKMSRDELAAMLVANSDEPRAAAIAAAIAGKNYGSTIELANAVRAALPRISKDEQTLSIRRVFQALRIAVNDEFSALDTFLRHVPNCLNPAGRVAILTFHSGEDRRVKKAFDAGLRAGVYSDISHEVIRPTAEERHDNPRSAPAKLRWARKADQAG